MFIPDVVALENHAALVFAGRVPLGELGALFDADGENTPNVHRFSGALGLPPNIVPFTDFVLLPCSHLPEPAPLFVEGGLRSGSARDFRLIDGPRNGERGTEAGPPPPNRHPHRRGPQTRPHRGNTGRGKEYAESYQTFRRNAYLPSGVHTA